MRLVTPSLLLASILGVSPVLAKGGPNSLASPDCVNVATDFPGRVFFPDSQEYAAVIHSYSSAFAREITPACIFRPSCAEDVSGLIKKLRGSSIKLAIKGGGVSGNPGAANTDNGITLDLESLTGIILDGYGKKVAIGAGERWQHVYSLLADQGLMVAGSRASSVGVGGLVLGGGTSFFDSKGFVCDNVVNFQVVLASGDIVDANATSNPDLFVALKGGSNNFGVVTRFDLTTFKDRGSYLGGIHGYNESSVPEVFDAFSTYVSQQDTAAHAYVAAGFIDGSQFTAAHVFNTEGEAVRPSLAPFGQIQPQFYNTIRSGTLLDFAKEESTVTQNWTRALSFTTSFKFDPYLIKPVYDIWNASLVEIQTVPGLRFNLAIQVISKDMITKSNALGPNSLGLTPEDAPLAIVDVTGSHSSAADDRKMLWIYRSCIRAIDLLTAAKYKDARFRFSNYAYKDEAVIPSYGADSVAKLQAVSKKYDPEGFFQNSVPGGFKLPKA